MGRFSALSSRVAVAVPGAGLFAAVAFIDSDLLTVAFFALIAFLTTMEAVRLLGPSAFPITLTAAVLAGGSTVSVALLSPGLSMVLLPLPGVVVSLMQVLGDGVEGARRRTAGLTGLTVMISLCFGLMARMRTDFESPWVMFIPLLLCWIGDSLAYFAGSAFGRHKMAPSVSPAKSWEGFGAGIAGSVAGALLAGTLGAGFGAGAMIAAGLAGGAAAVSGDLLESALKRDAGMKDSGALLSGHGGLLDRFDSLLAAVPVVWAIMFISSEWAVL
ncbi:MAG: hypothetical protein AVO35_00945 [Candidatus Aegiribacteria sp. MLS_C]|nr:MAG: hypothetical protein AVO35_00945 [Candidatus Aegiribacteria sp. MLS_C]